MPPLLLSLLGLIFLAPQPSVQVLKASMGPRRPEWAPGVSQLISMRALLA